MWTKESIWEFHSSSWKGEHARVFPLCVSFRCYCFLLGPLPLFPQGWQSHKDSVCLRLHYFPTLLNICNPASTIFAKMDFSELSPERSTALFSVGLFPVEPWPAGQSCAAGMLINTGFQASSDTFLSLWLIVGFFFSVRCVWLLHMKMFQNSYLIHSHWYLKLIDTVSLTNSRLCNCWVTCSISEMCCDSANCCDDWGKLALVVHLLPSSLYSDRNWWINSLSIILYSYCILPTWISCSPWYW